MYLTAIRKAKVLHEWEAAKRGPRGKPGQGFPDDEIIPLCDEINQIPWVVTLQSCAGHAGKDGYEQSAKLWLWLTHGVFWGALWPIDETGDFTSMFSRLAKCNDFESVSLLFGRDDVADPILEVQFAGIESGRMYGAGRELLLWLENLRHVSKCQL